PTVVRPTGSSPARSTRAYHDYVSSLLGGGMLQLCREYPVLARLIATTALLWRDSVTELLVRLAEDRDAIAACFIDGRELGELQAVDAGLSDAHAGGRTVHALTFACGLRLVYKPRGLGADAAFGDLLHWLAARGAPLPPVTAPTLAARVLDRGDHGWAEYVEHDECRDRSAVRRYYQYSGSLLALLYALGSTDCHYENIVAAGERPVLIDLETILQPEVERRDPPVDRARNLGARTLYDDSVLRTGMLPSWQSSGNDIAYDTGGLSATSGQVTPFVTIRWTAVNTDAMRIERHRAVVGRHPNMPLLAGLPVQPADHVGDIALGFTRMYEWLASHADSLLAPDGPVASLASQQVRFIARPSSVYDHVLRRSLSSAALRDGATRGIQLELLARGLLPLGPALWPLLGEEERALEQLDIPIFTLRGDATRVALGELHFDVTRSGLDVARSRFASLGPADLERQLHIIRSSFALRYPREPASAVGHHGALPADTGTEDGRCLSRDELLAAALEIAHEIRRMVLVDSRGAVTWTTVEPISTSGHGRLQATGYGLYDGLGGIALFLAAAARCGGEPDVADLARRALQPLRERLRSSSQSYVAEYGIGGAVGAASAIYALLRTGTILGDGTMVDDATLAAAQITPSAIVRDSSFDVLYGSAGAILALLALHRMRPSAEWLELAHRCGRHLLTQRQPVISERGTTDRVWRTAGGHAVRGFAHGIAGIACALLRLHAATGSTEIREAALEALRYEDALIDRELGGWQDPSTRVNSLRASNGAIAWCRGAAGIGLARLDSSHACHAAGSRAGVERAIALMTADGIVHATPSDDICCGAFGAIELLLATGLRWGDSTLLGAAHAGASAIVARRLITGRYRLSTPPAAEVYDPALYRGTGGIGYGLLRLCHPEMFPSLLLWE
ncbi:MAG TPA: type 2 lanthipeptide synthetase LanM family protein, partial [Gemmatimonadaceae bacterium]